MAIISTPLGFILRWIYNLVGNYGMSLLIFTVLMKIVLIPISVKQKKSSIRTAAFSPMIQQIQKKYANDPANSRKSSPVCSRTTISQ